MLIMAENSFDYIEGFVIINRTGILNNWRASFKPQDPVQASHFQSDGRVLYCLELTKNFNSGDTGVFGQGAHLWAEAEGTKPLGSSTPLVESSDTEELNPQICYGSLWQDPSGIPFFSTVSLRSRQHCTCDELWSKVGDIWTEETQIWSPSHPSTRTENIPKGVTPIVFVTVPAI